MVSAVIRGSVDGRIGMEEEVRAAVIVLRRYLFGNVYPHPAINDEIQKAKRVVREIYLMAKKDPQGLLSENDEEPLERRLADFIAGMTDSYALRLYRERFFPEAGTA
jgi:dGTPase